MSLSSDELWQRLLSEGLATPEQHQQWSREILPKLSETDANNGLKALLLLVDAGHLSKYQAKIIAGQSSEPIRYGAWVVEQPLKLPMWQGWYEVRRGPADFRWARPVTAGELQHLRPLLPSLPRALKLAALQSDGLLAVQPPELIDGTLLVFVASSRAAPQSAATAAQFAALSGVHTADKQAAAPQIDAPRGLSSAAKLLSQEFASRRCPPTEATRLIAQLAQALSEMHEQQIVHGRVLPDRIYVQNQRVVLVVDPLCAATGIPQPPAAAAPSRGSRQPKTIPLQSESAACGLIGSVLHAAVAAQFCAPEMRLPAPLPNSASDVYSLGCVWWWLLTGQAPPAGTVQTGSGEASTMDSSTTAASTTAAGSSEEVVPRPAASAALSLPADCSLPEPLWRCLRACLAPNPANRFASATELQRALLVAQRARPIAAGSPAPATAQRPVGHPKSAAPLPAAPLPAAPLPAAPPSAAQPLAVPQPAAAAAIPRRRRRRRGIPWLWPILGGSGVLIGLLLLLKFTGALQPSSEADAPNATRPMPAAPPSLGSAPAAEQTSPATDPRTEHYEIVSARPGSNAGGLWAPPTAPAPVPLDLLPPGGQLFISLRPDQWPSLDTPADASSENSGASPVAWSDVLGAQITGLVQQLQTMSGVPLADIEQITLAFYPPAQSGQAPRVCGRFHLARPMPLAELIAAWNDPADEQISEQISEQGSEQGSEQRLWVARPEQAFYIAKQPGTAAQATAGSTLQSTAESDVELVRNFSVGPADMIREVAELDGTPGPLLPHLEKLWNSTDHTANLSLLVSTPFLFTDGRELLNYLPSPLIPALKQWLGGDVRGAAMQVHWQPQWYLETRVVGASDTDAGKLLARQQQQVQSLPATVEQWLVSHYVHPYWRGLALRYPHMLRTFVDYSRFGVEHGTALMNNYLPSHGGTNLTLTSWIALQNYATLNASANAIAAAPSGAAGPAVDAASGAATGGSTANAAVDIEDYLSQLIQVSFDQEPIEVALQLVADEANSKLPPGTEPLRFVLDGAAFGKAGITRNQQLSNFRIEQQPVRDALTEIARRGNPVATVTDLREPDQRLLWVVTPDPDSASGASMILLTTRIAAKENGLALPAEFAPEP